MIEKMRLKISIVLLIAIFAGVDMQAQKKAHLTGEQFIQKYKTALQNRDENTLRNLLKDYSFQGRIVANHLHYKGVESHRNGLVEQAINELVDAQDLLGRLGDDIPRLEALHLLGEICLKNNRFRPALRYYEIGFDLARRLKNIREFIHFGVQAATIFRLNGSYDQAMPFLEEALKMAEEMGYQAEHAALLNNIGLLHLDSGNYKKALRFFENAMNLSVELNDKTNGGRILKNLGRTYHEMGRYEEALRFNARALSLLQDTGDRAGEADVRFNFGDTYEITGDKLNALNSFHESLGIYYEVVDSANAINALGRIAYLNWPNTTFKESLTSFEKNLRSARSANDHITELMLLKNMGEVLYQSGRYAEAMATLERARKLLDFDPNPEYERHIYSTEGRILYEIGRFDNASLMLKQALKLSLATHNDAEELAALNLTAKILFQNGKFKDALVVLKKSLATSKDKALYGYAIEAIVMMRKMYIMQAAEQKLLDLQVEIETLQAMMQPTDITPMVTELIGDLYFDKGDFANATLYYDETLSHYLRHDRKAMTGGAYLKIAQTLAANSDTAKAISHFEQALAAVHFVEDLDGIADAQSRYGRYRMKIGQFAQADTLLSRALRYMQASGNRLGGIECMIAMAEVERKRGNASKAMAGLNQTLKLARNIDAIHYRIEILNLMADISLENRSEKGAVKAYQHLYQIGGDYGFHNVQAIAATKIGDVVIRRSNLKNAVQYYTRALDIYKHADASESFARTTAAIGMIYNQGGEYKLAEESLKSAVEQFYDMGKPERAADIMLKFAEAMYLRNAFDESLDHAKNAMVVFDEVGNNAGKARALVSAAKAQININPTPDILQRLEEAFQYFVSLNDVAGKASAMFQIGEYYSSIKNVAKALRAYTNAAMLAEKSHESDVLLNAHMRIGMLNYANNQLQKSLQHYQGALLLAQNAGNRKITKHIKDKINLLSQKMK
ncbi:MAG: hypothetical protein DWQ05_00365 [Calditrichaeota bacterium]|nr:MAG: hypothetical protein DWQ05_00365 [Calditrichota bacterium]